VSHWDVRTAAKKMTIRDNPEVQNALKDKLKLRYDAVVNRYGVNDPSSLSRRILHLMQTDIED